MTKSKDSNEVYRVVVEGSEYRHSGYRNATGLFNTLKGARQTRTEVKRSQERTDWYRERRGEEPITNHPTIKIQKSVLVWEDVE